VLTRARDYFNSFDRRLWVLAGAWLVNGLGFSMVLPFLSLYLTKVRGITMSHVGVILLVAGLCRAFGQLVGGDVTHRLGCRAAIILAQVARVASYLVLAAVLHVEGPMLAIAALISFNYLTGAVFQCGADVLTARLTSGRQRVEAYGLTRVGLNAGWMSGPAIGAFLAKTPYSLLFLLAAIVSSTSLVMLFYLVRGVGAEKSGSSARRTMTALLGTFGNRAFMAFCAAWLVMSLLTSQLVSTLSVYTTEVTGITKFQLGWLYTINGLVCIVFQMPVAALLKRLRLTLVMAAGAAIYACGYVSFAWQAGFAGVVASVVVLTVGEIVVNPSATAMSSLLSKPGNLARNMGFFGLVRGIGFSLGPLIGGVLFDAYRGQPFTLWAVLSSFGAAAAVGFALLGLLRGVPRRTEDAGTDSSESR
jgi:predicted MFS family arabinose efflux permease